MRCAFEVDGRRCRAAGAQGNPPLCAGHRAPSTVDKAMDQILLAGVGYLIGRFMPGAAAPPPATSGWAWPGMPPNAPAPAAIDPRELLGFKPDQILDRATIQRRRRELALQYHPDKGNDPRMLVRINVAADQLLIEARA